MKNKHGPYKTVNEKRLSSGDERQRERGREIHSLPHSCLICKVLRNHFFLQEDEKILLKPKGSAIIFGQLER